jgi:cytochrome c551/c552
MPEPTTFEEMRAAQKPSFKKMRSEQNAWRPPTAEEQALEEDWLPFATTAVVGSTAITLGAAAGVASGLGMLAGEAGGAYLGEVAEEVHPSLKLPVYLGTGLLSAFTLEKWLIDGTVKATAKIPKFWSKEFTLAKQKGLLSEQFVADHADIIRGMDMGNTKDQEKMLNIFRQDAYQERMVKAGKRLEKLAKMKPTEVPEEVLTKLKKKKVLTDTDYERLAAAAREDAIIDYTSKFEKIRIKAVNEAADVAQQSHKMTDVIDTIIKDGGVSPTYKFASKETAELFAVRHPELKVTKAVSANLSKIADDFGYTSIDNMISDVLHTPSKTMFRRMASSELAPEFNRIYKDEILLRIAEKEADYIFKLHDIKEVGEEKLIKAAFKEATSRASNRLPANIVIKEVTALKKSVSNLLGIIQKAGKDKAKLLRLKKAYTQKLAEYQAAVKVKKEFGLINNRLKNVRGIYGEYKEQLDNLLAPLFKGTTKKLDETMWSFLTRKYKDEVSIGADLLTKGYDGLLKTIPFRGTNFMELTYKQAKDLDDFVKAFRFVAQNEKYIYYMAEKKLIESVVKEIRKTASTTVSKVKFLRPNIRGTQLEELAKEQVGAIIKGSRNSADLVNGVLSTLKRIEKICHQLDGFKTFGPAWKHIFNKTIMAEVAKEKLGKQVFTKYEEIFAAHKATTKIKPAKYWSATSGTLAGQPIRKEFALLMSCHSRNADNLKAMLEGLGVSRNELTTFLNTALTKTDLKLRDDVLDLLDDLFPVIAKSYKQKTGLTLQRVKGGRYFPIQADRRFVNPNNSLDDLFVNPSVEAFQAEVKKTFTEFREGGVKAVRLDFNSLTQHLADVVHLTTHWGPLNEIQRLTRNAGFQTAVESTMGRDIYKQFNPWLQNLARPSVTKIDKFMGRMRRNVTAASLMLVPKIAVKQFLSFITAMPEVGYKNSIVGLKDLMADPRSMFRAVKEAAPEMAHRRKTWNRDMAELMSEVSATGSKGMMQRVGYSLIHTVDEFTASAVWLGAYKTGLEKFAGDGNKAVNFATKIVRGTQPASAAKDIPKVMRSGEMLRAVTMFYSYWSVFHNQVAEIVVKGLSGHLTKKQVMGTLAWLTVAPTMVQQLSGYAWNSLTGREQSEEHSKEIITGTALNAVGGLPVARDITGALAKDWGYKVSPIIAVPETVVKVLDAGGKVFDEDAEFNQADLENAVKLLSYLKMFPSRAMITAVTGALRIHEGETDDWSEVIDRPVKE